MGLDEFELLFQWLQDEWLCLTFSDGMRLLGGADLITQLAVAVWSPNSQGPGS